MDADVAKRPVNEIDGRVGAAIRVRREALGLTVDAFAAKLEVTPEQVRRYEAGEVRVTASKLYEVSQLLNAPVATFFQAVTEGRDEEDAPVVELVRLVSALSGRRQQMVLDMARSIARAQLSD